MVFSSIVFILFFFPVFLITYYLVGKKFKNLVLLLFSIVFYAWGAPRFIFFLVGSVFANFYIVRAMYFANNRLRKKLWAALSITINLGLLGYFKYANFFIDNFNFLLEASGANSIYWTKVVLPIGISFFTFQSLTYTIDIYRKIHAPLNNPFNFLLYILMFPQMIAGPIVRFQTIADQITDRKETNEDRLLGFYRFIIGLAKKVLIADVLGFEVDNIMAMDYATLDSGMAWIGIVGFTFQIYFDFSGYSDMAIGIGRMIGFKFPENFDNPYIARSVTEFWRRWHITFSTFMRNYLYYPLGGSRVKTNRRLYFNLWFVFLVSGLWHGASWNFVIYGAFHGFFLVIERLFLLKVLDKVGKWPSIIFTFFVIVIARVFFRVEGLEDALIYLERLFAFDFKTLAHQLNTHFYFIMVMATLLSFITAFRFGSRMEDRIYKTNLKKREHLIYYTVSVLTLFFIIASLAGSGFSPFIYFRF
jgi:alginate O-acetyltransferase complex protein AlgI